LRELRREAQFQEETKRKKTATSNEAAKPNELLVQEQKVEEQSNNNDRSEPEMAPVPEPLPQADESGGSINRSALNLSGGDQPEVESGGLQTAHNSPHVSDEPASENLDEKSSFVPPDPPQKASTVAFEPVANRLEREVQSTHMPVEVTQPSQELEISPSQGAKTLEERRAVRTDPPADPSSQQEQPRGAVQLLRDVFYTPLHGMILRARTRLTRSNNNNNNNKNRIRTWNRHYAGELDYRDALANSSRAREYELTPAAAAELHPKAPSSQEARREAPARNARGSHAPEHVETYKTHEHKKDRDEKAAHEPTAPHKQ